MSTRATLHFHHDGTIDPEAIIYRHSDGYPSNVLPDLGRFFADVEAQTSDTRFNDPTYLAAKYVVWQSQDLHRRLDQYRAERRAVMVGSEHVTQPSGGELDFIGVGVVMADPGDIEYRYHVRCTGAERPKIDYEVA